MTDRVAGTIAAALALAALGRMLWVREPAPPVAPARPPTIGPRPPFVRGDPGPYPTEDFGDAVEVWPGALAVDELVGDGAVVGPTAAALVEATAWLPDGRVFESTRELEQPVRWQVGHLAPGLDAGLAGMRVGGQRLLLLEPDALFGAEGLPGRAPAGAALVWRIEVLDTWLPPGVAPRWPDGVVDLRVGDGPPAGPHPVIDYALWSTADPDEPVDSSFDRMYPLEVVDPRPFAATLAGMRVGGSRLARLPPEAAFGAAGRPPLVPAGSPLLLRIDVRAEAAPGPLAPRRPAAE